MIMLNNIYLFTGEEQFLLDKELIRRKEGFVQKFGSDSIFLFDIFQDFDLSIVKQAIYGGGLFVTKKLVIISGVPIDGSRMSAEITEPVLAFTDDLLARKGIIPDETLLIFVAPAPDKRLKFYKFLQRNVVVKSFDQYKPSELKDFIISQLGGIFIPNEAVQYMLAKVGGDLYRLRFECEKLRIRCEIKKISQIDNVIIDTVVFGQVETDAFKLLDHLHTDPRTAMRIIDKVQAEGKNRNEFAGLLYRGLKLSLFVADFVANGITDPKTIASHMKANPRQIATKMKDIAQLQADAPYMRSFFRQLVELDHSIKSGKLPETYFWLGVKKMLKIEKDR